MKLTLDGPDWTYGTMLRRPNHPHSVYMFVHRKPRGYMPDGSPNDRGFSAVEMSRCTKPYPVCRIDHRNLAQCIENFGGLPTETEWWEVMR